MKKDEKTIVANDIDEYLSAVPEEARKALEKLRAVIKKAAPKAEEKISYRMPTFHYLGPLVGFAAHKNHLGFYVMSYKVMELLKEELEPYKKATATIHFSADNPLPDALVKKIVKARIAENEENKK